MELCFFSCASSFGFFVPKRQRRIVFDLVFLLFYIMMNPGQSGFVVFSLNSNRELSEKIARCSNFCLRFVCQDLSLFNLF